MANRRFPKIQVSIEMRGPEGNIFAIFAKVEKTIKKNFPNEHQEFHDAMMAWISTKGMTYDDILKEIDSSWVDLRLV
jgi:hypothetical protein